MELGLGAAGYLLKYREHAHDRLVPCKMNRSSCRGGGTAAQASTGVDLHPDVVEDLSGTCAGIGHSSKHLRQLIQWSHGPDQRSIADFQTQCEGQV